MLRAILARTNKIQAGTFGRLEANDFKGVTLERPDYNHDGIIGNEKGNSCIPEGVYHCIRVTDKSVVKRSFANFKPAEHCSDRMKEVSWQLVDGHTFEIQGVTCGESEGDRTAILFHTANLIEELRGCIALGTNIGTVNNKRGIINSKEAFFHFMLEMYGVNEFELDVRFTPGV
jgi:hypothetical protein